MANALYGKARQAFLEKKIDWLVDNFKCLLIDTAVYAVSIDVDQFYTDIPGAAIIDTSANLGGKTSTLGTADANDTLFTAISGTSCEAVVIFQDTGVPATSRLVAYIDTATGLPLTPNGNEPVVWNVLGIFKL